MIPETSEAIVRGKSAFVAKKKTNETSMLYKKNHTPQKIPDCGRFFSCCTLGSVVHQKKLFCSLGFFSVIYNGYLPWSKLRTLKQASACFTFRGKPRGI